MSCTVNCELQQTGTGVTGVLARPVCYLLTVGVWWEGDTTGHSLLVRTLLLSSVHIPKINE